MKNWEKGMYLNQKDLIYIKTIVDEGGITQAARKLFVSQPSLSQSVKRIEESLGTDLFRRTPKGLILTPEGEEYYHMANKVMHIYESFDEEIHNLKELKREPLRSERHRIAECICFRSFLRSFI